MAGAEQRKARDSMKKGAFRLERSFLFSIKTMFAPNLHLDNHNPLFLLSVLVRMERLELSHLAAPEPKSGASTNFATSAFRVKARIIRFCGRIASGFWRRNGV